MKILISGAAGFLGRRFTEFYDKPENTIVAIDNMQSPYAKWPNLHYGWKYRQDIRDYIENTVGNDMFDIVIHMAAPVGGREKIEGDPLFNADSLSIDATVFRWAVNHARTLVYPSSSAVYPIDCQTIDYPRKLNEILVNPVLPDWGKPDEMYGFTKLTGEYLAFKAQDYGLRTIVLRPFSGYGPGQSQEYPFPSLMRRIVNREDPFVVWGDGEQTRDFIHVNDIVRLTDKVVFDDRAQGYFPINLGTGVPTSFNSLSRQAFLIEKWSPKHIEHLLDKPVGVEYRVADTVRMSRLDLVPEIGLQQGIEEVLEYERRSASRADG